MQRLNVSSLPTRATDRPRQG